METVKQIAKRTFENELSLHKDNPFVWHFWKRAFDCAFRELTKEGYWLPLNIQPPEKEVSVIDEFGNTGIAEPPYYLKKNGEHYWDGGWCLGLLGENIKGRIVGWRVAQHSI